MIASRWDLKDGELSEATLRRRFGGDAFRLRRNVYPAATAFVGKTRACTIYILRGSCSLRAPDEGHFTAGDVVDVDAGFYEIGVPRTCEVEIVTVWDLRPHVC